MGLIVYFSLGTSNYFLRVRQVCSLSLSETLRILSYTRRRHFHYFNVRVILGRDNTLPL